MEEINDNTNDDDRGNIVRELLMDFIQNINKHRGVVEELCVLPAKSYLSKKVKIVTRLSLLTIIAFFAIQIVIILLIWDIRKMIKRKFRYITNVS